MARLRNSDDRNIGAAQFPDIFSRVRCEQQAFRAIHDGLAARNGNNALAHPMPPRLRVVLTENFGIKLPGPFLAAPAQRVKGHVIHQKWLTDRLRRGKHVSAARGGIVRIATLRLVGVARARTPVSLPVPLLQHLGSQNHHVAQDQAGKSFRGQRHRGQADRSAKAVRNDDRLGRTIEQPKRLGNPDHLCAARMRVAPRPVGAVAHSRQVIGDDVMVPRQKRCDKRKAPRMRQKAMRHQDRGMRAVTPPKIVDARSRDVDEAFLARHGECFMKPAGQRIGLRCP